MADPKSPRGFFRKVVDLVSPTSAAPATDSHASSSLHTSELSTQTRESEFAKSELKAMIERKRRNDFVRKRELDMLRKLRREGISGEQAAALANTSRLEDDTRPPDATGLKADARVKDKIDEIELQMAGERYAAQNPAREPEFFLAPTQPFDMDAGLRPAAVVAGGPADGGGWVVDSPESQQWAPTQAPPLDDSPAPRAPQRPAASPPARPAAVPVPPPVAGARPAGAPAPRAPDSGFAGFVTSTGALEVNEIGNDGELDEAVIAFANAEYGQCEQSLTRLIGPRGLREKHADTWLVLFDLYRALGKQAKFEALALEYAQRFGQSAPHWVSLPQLLAEAASSERTRTSAIDGQLSWACPAVLDADRVAQLRQRSLQMPLPWVFDWNALNQLGLDGAMALDELFRGWADQRLDMRWLQGEHLFRVLAGLTPTGDRNTPPAFWQLRLTALRLANRPDVFDEVAIDYCVTYEVSPPSWAAVACQVRVSQAGMDTRVAPMTAVSELQPTGFTESVLAQQVQRAQVADLDLSGQLVGDQDKLLAQLAQQVGSASEIHLSCDCLIRVDFIAAGDLLNWVLTRQRDHRRLVFTNTHRLVALFFATMGITEHASVQLRQQ